MGTLALLLALTALWAGPEITQNNSWVGPIDQNRCSAIWLPLRGCPGSFYQAHNPGLHSQGAQLVCEGTLPSTPGPWAQSGAISASPHHSVGPIFAPSHPDAPPAWPPWPPDPTKTYGTSLLVPVVVRVTVPGTNARELNISRFLEWISARMNASTASCDSVGEAYKRNGSSQRCDDVSP